MLDLQEILPIREFRLEAHYTATRLSALEETRHLAKDFVEAADKFSLLEEEEVRLDVQRMQTQALVETADDAWDDTMHMFQRRLLDLSGNSVDHELYRKYFSDLPTSVTNLSYHAEILISKDLESVLQHEDLPDLRVFVERLSAKREALENVLLERTRLEVEDARFANRCALAKAILNKLRRIAHASLEEISKSRGRNHDWASRFFHVVNEHLESIESDGSDIVVPRMANGDATLAEHMEAGA